MPLVEKGFAQAEAFALALIAEKIRPSAVYCSPLQRTSKYAAHIIKRLNLPFSPTVDPRLNEIDYGDWTGLTNEEVKARFGEAALKGWDERSEWPIRGGWRGSPEKAISEVRSFVDDLLSRHARPDTIIVITSNGRLRYFLTLASGEYEKRVANGSFKVKTGNVCKLVCENEKIQIPIWNALPTALSTPGQG